MRTIIEPLQATFRDFIQQRDDFALIVQTEGGNIPALQKMVEVLEETSNSEIYWTTLLPFLTAEQFVDGIFLEFSTQHEMGRIVMKKEGMEPWPPLPEELREFSGSAAERMKAIMVFSRKLLPSSEGCLSVWSLFPAQVEDGDAYAEFVSELVQHDFPFPWCHHLRLITYDDPKTNVLKEKLEKRPRIHWTVADFSDEAFENALEREARDESRPIEERISNLMTLAFCDFAHKRFDPAREKFSFLADYYGTSNNLPLAAVALDGQGCASWRLGELDKAGEYFEAALIPAATAEPTPHMIYLMILKNLATLRFEQERWEEAESHFDSAHPLASVCRDAGSKLHCIEQKGLAQYNQEKEKDAVETWEFGVTIAHQIGNEEAKESMLGRLEKHFEKSGERRRLDELQTKLQQLDAEKNAPEDESAPKEDKP